MNIETIYVDSKHHCHRVNDGTMMAIEIESFIGKCDTYVEGYCYNNSKGYVQIYPWKSYDELVAAQHEYEKQKLENCLEALQELGVEV